MSYFFHDKKETMPHGKVHQTACMISLILFSIDTMTFGHAQLGQRPIILNICLTEAAKPEPWTFFGLQHLSSLL